MAFMLPGGPRPSVFGVEGFDDYWDPGFTVAYGVSEVVVARLVEAPEAIERRA